jgi:hypothetical protein
MKLTNKTGLPDPIVRAIERTEYVPSNADISVSALISPIRQVALRGHFKSEIVEDASDRIFALMGQIGHGVLEKSGYDRFTEHQLFMKLGNWKFSGRMDGLYLEDLKSYESAAKGDNPTWGIDDYKFTSSYVIKSRKPGERSRTDDWFLQLNLYRMLAEANGFSVGRLRLVLLLRDWSVLAAKRDPEFPQKQVVVLDAPLMDLTTLKSWAFSQIERHMEAQQGLDQYDQSHLPECTEEERWTKAAKYAVMKEGRKSAVRLLDSELDAQQWILDNVKENELPKHNIVYRPGENVRCENYCEVAPWCEQWKMLQAES